MDKVITQVPRKSNDLLIGIYICYLGPFVFCSLFRNQWQSCIVHITVCYLIFCSKNEYFYVQWSRRKKYVLYRTILHSVLSVWDYVVTMWHNVTNRTWNKRSLVIMTTHEWRIITSWYDQTHYNTTQVSIPIRDKVYDNLYGWNGITVFNRQILKIFQTICA